MCMYMTRTNSSRGPAPVTPAQQRSGRRGLFKEVGGGGSESAARSLIGWRDERRRDVSFEPEGRGRRGERRSC